MLFITLMAAEVVLPLALLCLLLALLEGLILKSLLYLKSVSGGGKNTMYIVPLPKDLDPSHLSMIAAHIHKTLKATC